VYAEALSARSVVSVACWVGVFVFFLASGVFRVFGNLEIDSNNFWRFSHLSWHVSSLSLLSPSTIARLSLFPTAKLRCLSYQDGSFQGLWWFTISLLVNQSICIRHSSRKFPP